MAEYNLLKKIYCKAVKGTKRKGRLWKRWVDAMRA